jgi:hypothetical protein
VDNIIEGVYEILNFKGSELKITIRPEPKVEEEANLEIILNSHYAPKRNNKKLKKEAVLEKEESIPFPLNFIKEAQQELEDETYNEVWTVFDHDNHPARKQAFEEADKLINGKKVNVAFSSISFEYYLLLHFERIFCVFEKPECREPRSRNKKPFNCGTSVHENDCYGKKCIGGYARGKKYWENSKTSESLFPLIKEKLEIGFINSAWLRNESNLKEKDAEIYNRNPYINSDELVKRLTGFDDYSYNWISREIEYPFNNFNLKISDNKLIVTNNSNISIILNDNSLMLIDNNGNTVNIGTRIQLPPNNPVPIELLEESKSNNSYYQFSIDTIKIFFQ